MNLIEKATIIHYHRHRIAEYGIETVEALGWKEDESQQKRFDVISSVGDLSGCSVLDIGCGRGDLKAYLDRRYAAITYIGVDQMPEFITDARRRYEGMVDTFFYLSDFTTAALPPVDYVIACGAMGYRCEDPHFFLELISRLFASATKALAFNMLDATRFPEHQLLVGHDREKVLAHCKTLSPFVKLVTGYLDDDFTVFMYADRRVSDVVGT